eukprot:TRINITY_DN15241_c0_g1_i1.p1 TRINITY_DN15241_c0_g1~~TRINITY_DN15241_c0_g1_i1.p1  ORF type:complete len:232 (-),score=26.52 TRINITY_DN15241_c0_g1_i1:21-647(-)
MTTAEPIRLYTNSRERERIEKLRDLFAIIKTVEHLERAWVRGAITDTQYTEECGKLIAQFKTAESMCEYTHQDVRKFMQQYKLNCKAAEHRLLEIGVPGTVEYGAKAQAATSSKDIAETVHHFITLMDSVKLNMRAVDQIFPELSELTQCLNRVTALPPDFEGRLKVREWLQTLNQMAAHDELSEEQTRQLLMDLEAGYSGFHRALQK